MMNSLISKAAAIRSFVDLKSLSAEVLMAVFFDVVPHNNKKESL
jgi:hypothetical protein